MMEQFLVQGLAPEAGPPEEVDNYHSVVPLDAGNPSKVFGFASTVYKGFHVGDGMPYALRRIQGQLGTQAKGQKKKMLACVSR